MCYLRVQIKSILQSKEQVVSPILVVIHTERTERKQEANIRKNIVKLLT